MAIDPSILDEIAANPTDESPQLVVADLLLEAEDPRGELIMLDRLERSGAPMDAPTLERLLTLAAVFGFPDPRDTLPVELPWRIHQREPLHAELVVGDRHYEARAEYQDLALTITGAGRSDTLHFADVLDVQHDPSDHDLAAIFGSIGDALHAGTPLSDLWFPLEESGAPTFDGGARRCYELPERFYRLVDAARRHFGLAARDRDRWLAVWGRLEPLAPTDDAPGWPGHRLPLFERRLALVGLHVTPRAGDDLVPPPATLYARLESRAAVEWTASVDDERLRDDFLERMLWTLGPVDRVLVIGLERQLAADAPWFEITPPRPWLPRFMRTQPGFVLLCTLDGARALLLQEAYEPYACHAYATTDLR